jgi:hypothetical protein
VLADGGPKSDELNVFPLDSPYFVLPSVMYFAKGHPLAADFSKRLQRLHSAGIVYFKYNGMVPVPVAPSMHCHGAKASELLEPLEADIWSA